MSVDISSWDENPAKNSEIENMSLAASAPMSNVAVMVATLMAAIKSGDVKLSSLTIADIIGLAAALADKADKATTLAGYGITDAKISNGTITLGNQTITPLTSHQDISGKADKVDAVKSITRSGTTFTATRADGTTFTFTQQDNNTKNTAGSTDTSDKIFLVGAKSQASSATTYSHDTAYIGTDGCLYSGGVKVLTSHQDISGKADINHSHLGSEITLTGYAEASSASAVAATDTVNEAFGKVQKTLDGKADKKTFSPTPVFTVTLDADTTATTSAPYEITATQMGGDYRELFVHLAIPAATKAAALRTTAMYSDGTYRHGALSNAVYTAARYVGIRITEDCGMAIVRSYVGTNLGQAAEYVAAGNSSYDPVFITDTATITKIRLALTTSGTVFPAGTVINVYAAS